MLKLNINCLLFLLITFCLSLSPKAQEDKSNISRPQSQLVTVINDVYGEYPQEALYNLRNAIRNSLVEKLILRICSEKPLVIARQLTEDFIGERIYPSLVNYQGLEIENSQIIYLRYTDDCYSTKYLNSSVLLWRGYKKYKKLATEYWLVSPNAQMPKYIEWKPYSSFDISELIEFEKAEMMSQKDFVKVIQKKALAELLKNKGKLILFKLSPKSKNKKLLLANQIKSFLIKNKISPKRVFIEIIDYPYILESAKKTIYETKYPIVTVGH